MIVVVKEK